jgi:nucleotide-binding universal stress UspA family protein
MNTPTEKPPTDSSRLRHILVPFDFSDGARLALAHAVATARAFNARITLFHVVHLPYLGSGFGPGDGLALEARLVEETSSQLDAIADEVKGQGVEAQVVVRVGHPSSEVVDLAGRDDIDLIIMGTHGRTGLKHVLLGSVAERVVRHAPCPVTVVRARAGVACGHPVR